MYTHNVKAIYPALQTQIDAAFTAEINSNKIIKGVVDTTMKALKEIEIAYREGIDSIIVPPGPTYDAQKQAITDTYWDACDKIKDDTAKALVTDPTHKDLKDNFIKANPSLGATPTDKAVADEYGRQFDQQRYDLDKLHDAQEAFDKLLDAEAKELSDLHTKPTRGYQTYKVIQIHEKYDSQFKEYIEQEVAAMPVPVTAAEQDEYRRQLEALKKIYDDQKKNEHDAQLRYINTVFDGTAQRDAMLAVALRKRGMGPDGVIAMTADALKKEIAQPAQYRSSNKEPGLLDLLFNGPSATMVTFTGDTYKFNPMDDEAVKEVLTGAVAQGFHKGKLDFSLGTKLQHTQMFAEMGPDNDYVLNKRALWISMLTSGIEATIDKNGFPEYTAKQMWEHFEKTGQILDEKAFASIGEYVVFNEVNIRGFYPTAQQKDAIDEFKKIRETMVKISNLRSLQEEGYKIELPHAIPADEDIESKKIYLYIEGVAPNQVVKFAAKDHAGNVQRIIIKDEDLSKVAPYVRNALNDPTKTDIKQLAFSAQSAIANVIMHHGYGPEPKAGTVISGHDTPVFRAPEEPDLTVTTKAPTK